MQQRLPSLLDPPITFAHRGAKAYAPDNTIEAFTLALKLGASGLESDVWVTSDGVAVLDHDGEIRKGFLKKQPIEMLRRDELPEHIPALTELFDSCGIDYHLSLDLKDDRAGAVVLRTLREHAPGLIPRTWLCHHDLGALAALRPLDAEVKLVNSTRLSRMDHGPERRASDLADLGIDGVNLRRTDWNGGLVALFHRFERTAFAWDLQHEHLLRPMLRMGIDAVYSDYVDRMVTAFHAEIGSGGSV